MHFYQERALVPKLLNFVFGIGVCTGVAESGDAKCRAMKKTCKYMLVPPVPPERGPSNWSPPALPSHLVQSTAPRKAALSLATSYIVLCNFSGLEEVINCFGLKAPCWVAVCVGE